MSLLRSAARAAYRTFAFIALVSAPVGTYYAYVAALPSPDAAATARNTDELRRLADANLAQEAERLHIDRAVLASLSQLLPAAEATRVGIDRLVIIIDRRLTTIREEQARRKNTAGNRRETPSSATSASVAGWWSRLGPASSHSRVHDEVFKDASDRR